MIRLSHPSKVLKGLVKLPSSKSISNRILLLQKMYEPNLVIENLSTANDTVLLKRILDEDRHKIDVEDAGTAYRFLLAYCAVTPGEWEITGATRIMERPIRQLVDALRLLGADISYLKEEGFAPLHIKGKRLKAQIEELDLSNVNSSQFISALLMIQPKVEGDFRIKIKQNMNSKSFVKLTVIILRKFGFSVEAKGAYLKVRKERRFECEYLKVEPDWTSFYYWYAMAQLAEEVDLCFDGLSQSNFHEEKKRLFDIGNSSMFFGENSTGICINKTQINKIEIPNELNYAQFPDLAPTFAVLLAALKVSSIGLRGLESLKYKESNREAVVEQILKMVHCSFIQKEGVWRLNAELFQLNSDTQFPTFNDHRIAMSVAPLALLHPILIENEMVVNKSYPHFWDELKQMGFEIEYL